MNRRRFLLGFLALPVAVKLRPAAAPKDAFVQLARAMEAGSFRSCGPLLVESLEVTLKSVVYSDKHIRFTRI